MGFTIPKDYILNTRYKDLCFLAAGAIAGAFICKIWFSPLLLILMLAFVAYLFLVVYNMVMFINLQRGRDYEMKVYRFGVLLLQDKKELMWLPVRRVVGESFAYLPYKLTIVVEKTEETKVEEAETKVEEAEVVATKPKVSFDAIKEEVVKDG